MGNVALAPRGVAYPRLAIVAESPPTWASGGSVLMRRLFERYPSEERIFISAFADPGGGPAPWLTGEYVMHANRTWGPRGLGRLRLFWSCLPWSGYVARLTDILRRHRIEVVHTIPNRYLWLAAYYAARALGIRYVIAVGEFWHGKVKDHLPYALADAIFGYHIRRADAVLGCHPGLAPILQRYGVNMAGIEWDMVEPEAQTRAGERWTAWQPPRDGIRVGYAGMAGLFDPELDLLRDALRIVRAQTGKPTRFVACVERPLEHYLARGWQPDELEYHGWVSYERALDILAGCDALWLIMSFAQRHAGQMMWGNPSKLAAYLQAGRPILIHAPPYASIVPMVQQQEFGALVTTMDVETLAAGIRRIATDTDYVARLRSAATRILSLWFDPGRVRGAIWDTLRGGSVP